MKKGVFGIVGLLAVMVWAPLLGAHQATQAGQTATTPPPVAPLTRDFAPKPYTVAAGDRIRLDFYGLIPSDLEMEKVYLVENDGTMLVKYAGSVRVHGRTAPEVAELVRKALVPNFYPEGGIQIVADVSEQRVQRVQVGGQVISPGEKELRGNQMTVTRAIAAANGYTPMAGQEVEIQREDNGKPTFITVTRTQLDGGDDPPLLPDDIITVKTGHVFFINGEVNSPGQKVWSPGMTVLEAIGKANGMTSKGKLGKIKRAIKEADGKVKIIEVKIKEETLVLPDDTVIIARSWWG